MSFDTKAHIRRRTLHFVGIDAHKDSLAAAAVDAQGQQLKSQTFSNDGGGFAELTNWARSLVIGIIVTAVLVLIVAALVVGFALHAHG
jgi:transposase